jgi:hypothetical protein
VTDLGYPKDGTDCCSRPPDVHRGHRCPDCLHFMTQIEGEWNCTWPHCITNAEGFHPEGWDFEQCKLGDCVTCAGWGFELDDAGKWHSTWREDAEAAGK